MLLCLESQALLQALNLCALRSQLSTKLGLLLGKLALQVLDYCFIGLHHHLGWLRLVFARSQQPHTVQCAYVDCRVRGMCSIEDHFLSWLESINHCTPLLATKCKQNPLEPVAESVRLHSQASVQRQMTIGQFERFITVIIFLTQACFGW